MHSTNEFIVPPWIDLSMAIGLPVKELWHHHEQVHLHMIKLESGVVCEL